MINQNTNLGVGVLGGGVYVCVGVGPKFGSRVVRRPVVVVGVV